ncbi:hypothetical protein Ahy_B03g067435 [Arachis hypogaea]|uniref:Poly(A) polymerase nucleotidyltransferase domain-containing protein n=1 Tax=Arachis hypogaea TaxID=3818 RepID=A0A445A720_ARAHY|nr:hypothetical protein Ahy_B03g067435 [Arachis hypogaea]
MAHYTITWEESIWQFLQLMFPTLVMLQEGMFLKQLENMKMRSFMSILLPSCPYEFCHSNITKSTFYHIRAEIVRGYNMTRDILKPDFTWDNIFELFPYSIKYSKFAKIYLYNTNQCLLGDWLVGSSPASAVFSSFLREPGICSFYVREREKKECYLEAQTDCVNMDQAGRCRTAITKASDCGYISHEFYCVKSAKVPLMRFKFSGISIDLSYACLNVLYLPESVHILHPFFLRDIDDTS